MTKVMKECKVHGESVHRKERNRYRCIKCETKKLREWRRKRKKESLDYKGNKCKRCGILDTEHPEIYEFHHRDPSKKDFGISSTRMSKDKLEKELDKCDLYCANCHRIVHSDIRNGVMTE